MRLKAAINPQPANPQPEKAVGSTNIAFRKSLYKPTFLKLLLCFTMMKQGINNNIFKLALLLISAAMQLFSCTAGRSGDMLISTHKYINYETAGIRTETGAIAATPDQRALPTFLILRH